MSFIYKVECRTCSTELELLNATMDNDYDIIIEVSPCPDCIEVAVLNEREKHDSPS